MAGLGFVGYYARLCRALAGPGSWWPDFPATSEPKLGGHKLQI